MCDIYTDTKTRGWQSSLIAERHWPCQCLSRVPTKIVTTREPVPCLRVSCEGATLAPLSFATPNE